MCGSPGQADFNLVRDFLSGKDVNELLATCVHPISRKYRMISFRVLDELQKHNHTPTWTEEKEIASHCSTNINRVQSLSKAYASVIRERSLKMRVI
jgi:hypothetical protein